MSYRDKTNKIQDYVRKDLNHSVTIYSERFKSFCDNFSRLLGVSITESNQHYSKREADNGSHAEGQEDVKDIICKRFQQQGAPIVEVDKFSGNPLEYQCFSLMFKKVVEKNV